MAGNPAPGTWSGPTPDQAGAVGFLYSGPNARFAGGTTAAANPALQYTAAGPGVAFTTWRGAVDGQIDFWVSARPGGRERARHAGAVGAGRRAGAARAGCRRPLDRAAGDPRRRLGALHRPGAWASTG